MKKISDIYKEYKIMPILQMHMLRVAAVASLICDNFNESLPKEDIVTTCLLHDMGNIIKSRLDVFPEFLEPEGLEYWLGVKDEFIKKYGNDEIEGTVKILQDLGMPAHILEFARENRFSMICKHRDIDDMSMKIIHYADLRVSPYGIVSYEGRMAEAKERYKKHKGFLPEEERNKLIACGKEVEKQIFAKCKIKPEDINDEAVKNIIEELKNYAIK